jgi:hypothetical protein
MDCIIPLAPKDLPSLPWCIDGLRRHVTEVGDICIVGKRALAPAIQRLALDVRFLDEERFLRDHGIELGRPTSGWLLQQLIKLGAHCFVGTDQWLAVDADTVFLRSFPLTEAGRAILTVDDYRSSPAACWDYAAEYRALLGMPFEHHTCFIAHHMVFERSLVRELVSRFPFDPWWRVFERPSRFSEYDFYGAYLARLHPSRFAQRCSRGTWLNAPWRWWDRPDATRELFETLAVRGWSYVSCHGWLAEFLPDLGMAEALRFAHEADPAGSFASLHRWSGARGIDLPTTCVGSHQPPLAAASPCAR